MSRDVFLLGLDTIGASIGMALGSATPAFTRIGYDAHRGAARAAQRAGAVDRVDLAPEEAAGSADIVFLAVPLSDVRPYLELLGPRLKRGAVVIETSPLKQVVSRWAKELIPAERYILGALPTLGPAAFQVDRLEAGEARADLFQGSLLPLVIPAGTPEAVVNFGVWFANALGATPFFVEAAELDSLMACVEGLPALLGAVLMRVAKEPASWREMQRLAGRAFALGSSAMTLTPAQTLASTLIHNRESVLLRLDAVLDVLQRMRAQVSEGDEASLVKDLSGAAEAYQEWLASRREGQWARQEHGSPDIRPGGLMRTLFGMGQRKHKDRGQR